MRAISWHSWRHKLFRFGKKLENFKYLQNKKSFLDEIKSIFHSLKDYHLVKNK